MSVTVRPHTKMMSAVLAAGVVAAAAPAWVPEAREAAATVSTQAVRPAGVIADFLENVGYTVAGIGSSIAIPIDGLISLPFDAVSSLLVSLQRPEFRADLTSWLANRYLNPSDLYADEPPYPYTYPNAFKNYGLGNALALLPPGLYDGISTLANNLADRINGVLGDWADPLTGEAVMQAFWGSGIGRVVTSVNSIPLAPVWAIWDVVSYAGWLPYDLFTSLEAAVRDPRDIPGLISNLAWGLLGPNGLVGALIDDLSYPLTNLPGLVGEISTRIVNVVYDVLDGVLSLLPEPVSPVPTVVDDLPDNEFAGAAADSIVGAFGVADSTVVTVSEGAAADLVEPELIVSEEVTPEIVEAEPDLEPAAPAAVDDGLAEDEELAGEEPAEDELTDDSNSSEPEVDEVGPGNASTSGGNQTGTENDGPPADSDPQPGAESGSGEPAAAA